jgi:nitrate reductase delta subunit
MTERLDPLKLVSVLLQYPHAELWRDRAALRDEVRALEPGPRREALLGFLEAVEGDSLARLQRRYVEDFDFSRRSSLHLTYHRWGDLRQRGLALLRLKQRYAETRFELLGGELPDYLPVLLEFCALAPEPGNEALGEHREAIELVRSSLREQGSPYAHLLEAVVAGLPKLSRRQAARAAKLAADGPPSEEVGLEPFAPPEVMPIRNPEPIPTGPRR